MTSNNGKRLKKIRHNISAATQLLQNEKPYPLQDDIKIKIGVDS
jgi:hypothetical protein